jgi:hypothetical protein
VLRRDPDVAPVEHLEQLGEYESWQVWHVGRHHDKLLGMATQLTRYLGHRDVRWEV